MIKDLISDLWDTNRLLLGQGANVFQAYMSDCYPQIRWSGYPSGQRVMTWRVPEEWIVKEAYIEDENHNRYLDYKDNPLHLVAYSTSIDKWMDWDDLTFHLYNSPDGVPWKFKYYERDWGFCCSGDEQIKVLSSAICKNKLHIVINTEFKQGTMWVGEWQLGNRGKPNLLIATHYDHPYQANDGLSGVAVAVEVAERLQRNPPDWIGGVRILFLPETIGSIAYFTDHSWDDIVGGIFLDACGNDNKITLQWAFSDDWHYMDRLSLNILNSKCFEKYKTARFRENFCNDEIVINSPPMNIPCIGLSRYPYPQYHTSADTIDIIQEDKLVEMADVVEEIARRVVTDYIPIQKYSGVPFLSGYNLWVDWADDPELNKNIEKIFMRFNGKYSVSQIADEIGMNYWDVRKYVERFREAGLINIYSIGGD